MTNTQTPTWAPERHIEPEEVRGWLATANIYPQQEITLIAEGFDNYIFKADELFVRAVRRTIAVPDIIKEITLLPLLAKALETNIPEIVYTPPNIKEMTWPWYVFRPVEGLEAAQILHQPTYDMSHVASSLGRALRQLHHQDLYEQTRNWVREDEWRRTDMPHRINQSYDQLKQLSDAEVHLPTEALHLALEDAQSLGVMPHIALVHGDLHIRHVMLNDLNHMTGIIDWGDAHIGHPACDFYPYWALFTPIQRLEFLKAYGPVEESTLLAGRVVSIFINAILALSAEDFGLPTLKAAAIQALHNTAEQ